ncbi:shikimate kinase [Pectinatus frisingensis]|uniref:shikimate kinase n=1 Tax=Pectinatus frisingensis TaxID=865 RepID=UPI0015F40DAA|nr:shikimate kinase [Pectinatus frisingensis]
MKNIALIGFMGTGKSCVGKLLAEKLGFSFIDTDLLVEQQVQMTIPQIFQQYGEAYFRECEKKAVKQAVMQPSTVIATGGGVPLFEENRDVLQINSAVICLRAEVKTIMHRTKGRNNRPLLNSQEEKIQSLLDERKPFYAQADFLIDTDALSPLQIVNEIILYLRRMKN